ncbi:MAG: helix-turn-helix domain-containing protein [Blastocatellia bacterium]
MLRLIIREVAERAGITSARELARLSGIPYESCRRFWNGEAEMIALKSLEKLCSVLDVPPAQLIKYTREPNDRTKDRLR